MSFFTNLKSPNPEPVLFGKDTDCLDLPFSSTAAFEEIDWQDFVVAGTVELTETDAHIDLPPPMSLREVENMTMAQKRMAAMIMEVEGVPEEEAKQTVGIVELPGGDIAGANAGQSKPVRAGEAPSQPADEDGDMEMEMDESDDEDRPPQVEQIKRADGHAPMKIRKDYVPKSECRAGLRETPLHHLRWLRLLCAMMFCYS